MTNRTSTRLLVLLAILTASPLLAGGVTKPPATLDDALLEDLGGKEIGQLDRELLDTQPEEAELAETSGTGTPEGPLASIARRMRDVASRISRADCGGQTQQAQQAILADLDALIQQAKQSCGQCAPAGEKPQGVLERKPATQSCNKPGTKSGQCQGKPTDKPGGSGKAQLGQANLKQPGAQHADMNEMKNLLKRLWGELPPREREQMLQLPVEEFLPEYELMIEDYFRRLSEEKGNGSESR